MITFIIGVMIGFVLNMLAFGRGIHKLARKERAVTSAMVSEGGELVIVDTATGIRIPPCENDAKLHGLAQKKFELEQTALKKISKMSKCERPIVIKEEGGSPVIVDGKPVLVYEDGTPVDPSEIVDSKVICYVRFKGSTCIKWSCTGTGGGQVCTCVAWG